jgi:ribonucleoside-diphosphate reductase alpha chain
VQWETRTASIGNDKGSVIFEQRDIEVPVDWSQTATNIVASKYFHGKLGSPERETSVAQLVQRVVDTIAGWGRRTATSPPQDGENFRDELAHLMLTRRLLQFAGLVQRGREGIARLRLVLRPPPTASPS